MLSKAESMFLKGELNVSDGYRRKLEFVIRRKLENFESQTLPVILSNNATKKWFLERVAGYINGSNSITGIGNDVTKFGNGKCATGFSSQGIENSNKGFFEANKNENAFSKRARSLGWIRTLACGAVVLWFRR